MMMDIWTWRRHKCLLYSAFPSCPLEAISQHMSSRVIFPLYICQPGPWKSEINSFRLPPNQLITLAQHKGSHEKQRNCGPFRHPWRWYPSESGSLGSQALNLAIADLLELELFTPGIYISILLLFSPAHIQEYSEPGNVIPLGWTELTGHIQKGENFPTAYKINSNKEANKMCLPPLWRCCGILPYWLIKHHPALLLYYWQHQWQGWAFSSLTGMSFFSGNSFWRNQISSPPMTLSGATAQGA